jgi:hypothetical protein
MAQGAVITPSGGIREYLEVANRVTDAMQEAYPDLMEVVDALSHTWHNEVFGGELTIDPICALPFMQSNFLWSAGVRTALSGHPIAAFPILRSSIEAAAYTYLMVRSERVRDAWAFRERSDADRKAARGLLTQAVSDTAKALGDAERGFGAHLNRIYQETITFGAHPNPRSAFKHLVHTGESADYHYFNSTCIAGPESENALYGLIASIEVGLVASFLSALALPNHPNLDRVRRAHSDVWDLMAKFFEGRNQDSPTDAA